MNYKKIIANTLCSRSSNNSQVIAAALIGVAVGAVFSVLFAPESGSDIRSRIANKIKGFDSAEADEPEEYTEPSYVTHAAPKKPKSDIKDLIHEAHSGEHHS
ncbi:MAG: YtxH domain-containing protein [Pedobacter sp.]|nr:MAG: YtxH domain-containing protein [Pedobacter sp.]